MNAAHYIDTDAYRSTLDRIIHALSDPGHDLRTTVVEILGDVDIWPDYCRPESPSRHLVVTKHKERATPVSSLISLAHVMAA